MTLPLSQRQARRVDQIAMEQFHLPGIVLMENAGRNCAEWLLEQSLTGPVTILAGKGNNAGDGFVIARHLHNRGIDVRLLLVCPPDQFQGDALINWQVVEAMQLPCRICDQSEQIAPCEPWLLESTWLVDALLGTGIEGTVREPFFQWIEAINRLTRNHPRLQVFAVDLPSGLNCDTGEICGTCIQATLTATFVAPKQGLLQSLGPNMSGTVRVVDIGVPRAVIELATRPEA